MKKRGPVRYRTGRFMTDRFITEDLGKRKQVLSSIGLYLGVAICFLLLWLVMFPVKALGLLFDALGWED